MASRLIASRNEEACSRPTPSRLVWSTSNETPSATWRLASASMSTPCWSMFSRAARSSGLVIPVACRLSPIVFKRTADAGARRRLGRRRRGVDVGGLGLLLAGDRLSRGHRLSGRCLVGALSRRAGGPQRGRSRGRCRPSESGRRGCFWRRRFAAAGPVRRHRPYPRRTPDWH